MQMRAIDGAVGQAEESEEDGGQLLLVVGLGEVQTNAE